MQSLFITGNVLIDVIIYLIASIMLLGLGLLAGYYFVNQRFIKAGKSAKKIIEDAENTAEENRKAALLDSKQEIHRLRQDAERDIRERKKEAQDLENKLTQREIRLDRRSSNLDNREGSLNQKERHIDNLKLEVEKQYSKVEEIKKEQEKKLIEIAGIGYDKARDIILSRVEENMAMEITSYIKEQEEKAKHEASHKAQSLLAHAIQQYANETVNEKTVSVVTLPNDEMKGRIIGREGRNIRAFEAATGVDVIIDDTPEAVVLSCFDPIRREIARRALEALVADGRIQPPRIEELVKKFKNELDTEIRETGEKAVFETGIGRTHPELVKLIGRLKYRTSYGQNALTHSMEVSFLTGKLAAEIGLNETIGRRAGLLHDIGKAADHEMEGSHVDIGIELANRYKEKPEIIDAIASHHGDHEPKTLYAHLVAAADTLSAARPGARSESLENYLKRLTKLEEICNQFEGVEKSYALQAGREIRVLVKPDVVDDLAAHKLARDMRMKIEQDINYPGTIKVMVIRETRVQEIAK